MTKAMSSFAMNVLFFAHPGTNSRRILLDMAHGFTRAGCRAVICELGPLWSAFAKAGPVGSTARRSATRHASEQIAALIKEHGVDFSIAMWSNAVTALGHSVREGKPINFFEAVRSPHLLFWLDAPQWAHQGAMRSVLPSPLFDNEWLHHLVNNEATAAEMTEVLGFGNVVNQPYGVNEEIFRPRQAEVGRAPYDIVFGLGPGDHPPTEVMQMELHRDEPDVQAIRKDQAQLVRRQVKPVLDCFATGNRAAAIGLIDAMVESQLSDPQRPMLERLRSIVSADPALAAAAHQLLRSPALFIDVTTSIRAIDGWQRAFMISYLSHHFRCAVFGSPSLAGWDCRADQLGQLEHEAQALAYSQGRLGLNVMRWQDDVGLNLKPFEISACGVPCVMAHRPGAERCFDLHREIVMFQSPGEARRIIQSLLEDESARQSIAEAALHRVRSDHTWTVRSRQIADRLAPALAAGAAAF